MWLFTKYGFFGVVSARKGDSKTGPVDPDLVIIRARVRGHLERLIVENPVLRGVEIDEDRLGLRDYRFLAIVPKEAWVAVAAKLAADVDYPKFKPSVVPDLADRDDYMSWCLDVWRGGFDLQNSWDWPETEELPNF